jgi:hypothetical protein
MIWGIDFPTTHVHSSGMFGDFDPTNPGMEFYIGKKTARRTGRTCADGRLLRQENLGAADPVPLYWEAGCGQAVCPTGAECAVSTGRRSAAMRDDTCGGGYSGGLARGVDYSCAGGAAYLYDDDTRGRSAGDADAGRYLPEYVAMVSMGVSVSAQLSYYLKVNAP